MLTNNTNFILVFFYKFDNINIGDNMNFDDEDKFVLKKSNIIMIIIVSILVIITIITSIFLYKSLKNEVKPLPDLQTTLGRTSTVSARVTTEITTTSTTTTIPPSASPYYKVNVDDILSDEILTKGNPENEEAKEISLILFEFLNKLYNPTDNSLFNISSVVKFAKEGEEDKITVDSYQYGEIYNGNEIIDKAIAKNYQYLITGYKFKNAQILKMINKKYYRLYDDSNPYDLVAATVSIEKNESNFIRSNIKYYYSNYQEKGYTSPVYKNVSLQIVYDNNRWKVKEYAFKASE